jgi:Oligoendopeptidase F
MAWNLNALYGGVNSDKFKSDMNLLKEKIDSLSLNINTIDFDAWNKTIADYQDILILSNKLKTYVGLFLLVEQGDKNAISANHEIGFLENKIKQIEIKILYLCDDSVVRMFDNHEYKYFIETLNEKRKHYAQSCQEEILSQIPQFSSNSWVLLHKSNLNAIKPDGLSLAKTQSMQMGNDFESRKQGYYHELKIAEQASNVSSYAINGIKSENILTAKVRNYDSVLDMCLQNDGLNVDLLNNFFKILDTILPQLRLCVRKKSGNDTIKWYNLLYSSPKNINFNLSPDEAITTVKKAFSDFSLYAENMINKAIENSLIDHEPRENKRNGACCDTVYDTKETYVMLTYAGSYKNFSSLAHELGHSYHHTLLNENPYFYSSAPYPISEMISTFFEMVVADSLKEQYPQYSEYILEGIVSGMIITFMEVYSRYIFENNLYKEKEKGFVSADVICNLMLDSQKQIYGETNDPESYNPYNWVVKPHFYYTDVPYYNYSYIVGRLGSLYLFGRYKKKGSQFVSEFEDILKKSGKQSTDSTLNQLGIKNDDEFFSNTLKTLNSIINEYLA